MTSAHRLLAGDRRAGQEGDHHLRPGATAPVLPEDPDAARARAREEVQRQARRLHRSGDAPFSLVR